MRMNHNNNVPARYLSTRTQIGGMLAKFIDTKPKQNLSLQLDMEPIPFILYIYIYNIVCMP